MGFVFGFVVSGPRPDARIWENRRDTKQIGEPKATGTPISHLPEAHERA